MIGASLEFQGVSVRYGDFVALHETTLKVEPGEFFALLGPSGSGKSTLLGSVAGFIVPTAGRILVNGRDITAIPPYRREIGMVFQNYSLFPFMTVAENVAFPLKNRRMPRAEISARVRRILEMVRLSDLGNRMPRQLSGGQQQRVALARAAVYDPPILLMDEPLGALDKNLREQMQDEVKSFHRKIGATVLYVTHDQYEAAVLASRIGIMNAGRLKQIDEPQRMYENPKNAFIAGFLGEANLFTVTKVERVDGCVWITTDNGLMLTTVAAIVDAGPLVACVRPERVRIGNRPLAGDNVLQGVVEDAVFSAGAHRYRIRVGKNQTVIVRPPPQQTVQRCALGSDVYVVFDRTDVMLIAQ